MYESKKKYFYGTGRRKSSVARVRVYENGTGSIIINGRQIDWMYYGISWATTLVLLFVGIVLFSRVEKTFMDTV